MTRPVFVPSPFVGAQSWRAMVAAMPGAVIGDYGGVQGQDWYEGVARRLGPHAPDEPWTAALHSGAGGFAPVLAARFETLAGFVFLDAILPHPGRSVVDTAPPWLIDRLRGLRADDGRLAPWNTWFTPDPTLQLIPEEAARAAFVADLPRTPFAFLEAAAPLQTEWERLPCAYIQLSPAYRDTADKAEARGWPVRRAALNHLAMLTHPTELAALLRDVLA